jgi:hypothetical protein
MATGPEHYRRAEKDLEAANGTKVGGNDHPGFFLARAQVHATLALAAAQVEDMDSDVMRPGWAEIVDGGAS